MHACRTFTFRTRAIADAEQTENRDGANVFPYGVPDNYQVQLSSQLGLVRERG